MCQWAQSYIYNNDEAANLLKMATTAQITENSLVSMTFSVLVGSLYYS